MNNQPLLTTSLIRSNKKFSGEGFGYLLHKLRKPVIQRQGTYFDQRCIQRLNQMEIVIFEKTEAKYVFLSAAVGSISPSEPLSSGAVCFSLFWPLSCAQFNWVVF